MPRRRHHVYWDDAPEPNKINRCRILVVVDNAPLQRAAWAELQAARRRLAKVTGDVHRHEEKDEPAFRAWLGATFSTLVSTARDLAQQVEAKGRLVQVVQDEAFFTQRSPAAIWRDWQRRDRVGAEDGEGGAASSSKKGFSEEDGFEEEMKRFFSEADVDEDDPDTEAFREFGREIFGGARSSRAESAAAADARTIYRRLVQQLHPDRGGEWTPARARLWEQVQEAWQNFDADWLARLEAEWDTATDSLGPTSPLGRLRAALKEIDAARRDTERRVRNYRKQLSWRFTLKPPAESLRVRLERELNHDCRVLREQLDEIEALIERWETVRPRKPRRRSGRASWEDGMPLF